MEFLVEFRVGDAPAERVAAEAVAAAALAAAGYCERVWKQGDAILALYRAADAAELDGIMRGLPLHPWLEITITPLEPHPNDPLPLASLRPVYHLEATVGAPLVLGSRRIVPLTGGSFTGTALRGTLVPGASADWQTVLPDGTAIGDIRYTLQTDAGDVLYVQSHSTRHGPPEVLARLARGEAVDPSEYTFRASTSIETAAPELAHLNQGIFISVGARSAGGVTYDTYLVA